MIIVGDGAKLNELKAQCHTQQITNVIFTGAVSPNMVLEYMKAADILFAQIGANFMSAVPTKVFEYIAPGRRVLLGLPIGPARELFSKFHGVEIFEVGNKLQLEASYKALLGVELNQGLVEENLRMLEANHSRETDSAYLIHTISEVSVA
ncbi:glycosyltransferase [Luminiphilus sp.]|nr:glycosyltransferase [Luminiphilus sp.]